MGVRLFVCLDVQTAASIFLKFSQHVPVCLEDVINYFYVQILIKQCATPTYTKIPTIASK